MKVIVPLSAELDPDRARLWEHARKRWPVEVVEGRCDGPWRKGAAVRQALERVSDEVVAIADADVIGGASLAEAEAAILVGAPWVQPFNAIVRLNAAATERVLLGEDPLALADDRFSWAAVPYHQATAGGLVVLRREVALAVPMDSRFVGWGGEDAAWRDALDTMVGRRVNLPGTLVHLWHLPKSRAGTSRETKRLLRAYRMARGKPEAMRALVAEALQA